MANANLKLLSSLSRVETPFIKVIFGDYVFGVVQKTNIVIDENQIIKGITYPNYIQSLDITKINGVVNKYNLNFVYAVTENDDPNFFEKVFGSISKTRKIIFEYGDLSAPSFCYRREEALFLSATTQVSASSSTISYRVNAISSGNLLSQGSHTFPARYDRPSNVIKELLYGPNDYGLLDVFEGMTNRTKVEQKGLIFSDDLPVNLLMQTNMSVLDYITYLVKMMKTANDSSLLKKSMFSIVVMDDTSGEFGGAYFKVQRSDIVEDTSFAYELDIGYPSQNIVTDFKILTENSYSIYYDFQNKLNDSKYVARVDDEGNIIYEYAPVLSSGTATRTTTEADRTWWTNVTSFPIKASLTIRGLLRPAILMTNVKLNVYFYGRKHLSSGLYVVTGESDHIDTQGFRTTLTLLRVGDTSVTEAIA